MEQLSKLNFRSPNGGSYALNNSEVYCPPTQEWFHCTLIKSRKVGDMLIVSFPNGITFIQNLRQQ